jgi:SAM-dependent methyltransferase
VSGSEYARIRAGLLQSYGPDGAARRDQKVKPPWKLAERDAFLDRLRQAGCRTLLDAGAGTGQDSQFFADAGLDVVATDLSPAMVAVCRAKGLRAAVMDFGALAFPDRFFDAMHAMNCLLHVPTSELPRVLRAIGDVLRPGGLFFLGAYGGDGTEGVAVGDDHVPPRFFSWRTDRQMLESARESFEVVDFHVVSAGGAQDFCSLTLRRPDSA